MAAEGAEQLEGSYTAGEMRLPFSEDEDKRLVALVQKHGVPKHGGSPTGGQGGKKLRSRALVSWKFLAEKFSEGGSTRGGAALRSRYYRLHGTEEQKSTLQKWGRKQ